MSDRLKLLAGPLLAVVFFGVVAFFDWRTNHWIAFVFSTLATGVACYSVLGAARRKIEPPPAFTGHYRINVLPPSPMPIGVRVVTITCWTCFAIEWLFFRSSFVDRWSIGAHEVLVDHQWWRFITSVFSHAGTWHIMMNMAALAALGGWIEHLLGARRFAIIFAVAALGGGIAVVAFGQERTLGASGAIFGFIGALIALAVQAKRGGFEREARWYFKTGATLLAVNLAFTLAIPFISFAAHFGGAIFGFAAALALGIPDGLREVWALTKAFPESTHFTYEGDRDVLLYHGPARYALESGFVTLDDWVSAVDDETRPPVAPLKGLDLDRVSLSCGLSAATLKSASPIRTELDRPIVEAPAQ